jgi:hypothetical protein
MYGYRKNGEKLYVGGKAIERMHVLVGGVPVCGEARILCVTDYKMGKPVCKGCESTIRREAKMGRLGAAIKRSADLFL